MSLHSKWLLNGYYQKGRSKCWHKCGATGTHTWCSLFGKENHVPVKLSIHLSAVTQENESVSSQKTGSEIHSSLFFLEDPKLESTQMSIYRWVDKHTLVYLYSGELVEKNSDRNELLTLLHRWVTESKSVVAQSSGAKGDFGVKEMCILALLFTWIMMVVALDVRAGP